MKRMLREHPNYGRETLRSGADEWWKLVIRATVVEGIVASSPGIGRKEAQRLFAQADSGPHGLSKAILHRFSAQGKGYKLFDDVQPFFSALADHNAKRRAEGEEGEEVRCVLASNSDERILGACEALGLGKLGVSCRPNRGDGGESEREGALLSYDLGYSKPSPDFFREALRLAGTGTSKGDSTIAPLKGEEVLYVGDDLEEDARGARDSGTGITGVWLDREGVGRGKEDEDKGVKRVESLKDVLALVEERERAA